MLIINSLSRSKLDARNMVNTSDYVYLNNEIDSDKPLKMLVPGAERMLSNK